MIDKKQQHNAESNISPVWVGVIKDARCTGEIKSKNAITKAVFNKKETFSTASWDFKEETSKVLHLEHSFVWCWNLDTSKNRTEILGKF